jgi:hypothetical protein
MKTFMKIGCNAMLNYCLLLLMLLPAFSLTAQLNIVPQILPKTFSTNGLVNCIQKKGNTLFVGGEFDKVGFAAKGAVAFAIGDSLPMSDFPVFNGEVTQAISDANGGWYVAGSFDQVNGISILGLAHINSDFSIDTAFNLFANNPTPDVKALLLDAGVLYVGGYFTYNTGVTRNNLLAISTATKTVTSWNPDPDSEVTSMVSNTTSVFVTGSFSQIGGAARNSLAGINKTTGLATSFDPAADGTVYAIALSGNLLYVAGGFSMLGDSSRASLGAVNVTTNQATTFNPIITNGTVSDIKLAATTLYLVGDFTDVNNTTRNYVAALNTSTGALTAYNPNPNNTVQAISISGTNVYLSGVFDSINGTSRNSIAATNSTSGALTNWNPQFDQTPTAVLVTPNAIFVAGNFNFVNPQSRRSIYAIDIATNKLLPFDAKLNDRVANSLPIVSCIHIKNDSLFVGGTFDSVNHVFQQGIVAYSITTGQQLVFNPYASIPQAEYARTTKIISSPTKLFVLGRIKAGAIEEQFHEIDLATGQFSVVNHVQPNEDVTDMIIDNNILYIVGTFGIVNSESRNGYAAFQLPNFTLQERNIDSFIYTMGLGTTYGATKIQIVGPYIYLLGAGLSYSKNPNIPPLNNLICIDKYNFEPLVSFRPFGITLFPFTFYDMQANSNFIVVAGGGVSPDNNMVAFRISNNYSKSWIPQVAPTNAIVKFLWQDGVLALGGVFDNIANKPRKQLSILQLPLISSKASFVSINPTQVANKGRAILTILGTGFTNATSFKLTKAGQADLFPLPNVSGSLDANNIGGFFDFNNKALGKWNLVVTIPDDTIMTIANAIEIDTPQKPDLYVSLNFASPERLSRKNIIEVIYGNNSNVAVENVPLKVAFEDTAETIELISGLDYTGYTNDSFKLFDPFYVMDSLAGERNPCKVFPLLIRNIPPHTSGSVFFRTNGNGSLTTRWVEAFLSNPLYDEEWLTASRGEVSDLGASLACAISAGQDAMDELAGYINYLPGTSTLTDNMTAFTKMTFNTVINAMNGNSNQSDAIASVTHALCDNIEDQEGSPPAMSKAFKYSSKAAKYTVGGVPNRAKETCDKASQKIESDKKNRTGVGSYDPNNKTGPNTGGSNFVRSDIPFPYTIRFENLETATAAAQDVLIVDTLDKANFDLSTFELGSIIIGNHFFTVPRGKKEYVADIDLRPEIPLIAEISAALNTTTGVVTWRFSSLDTLTGLPTNAVLDGFLPPNTLAVSPQGQGAVAYSVRLKAGVASQTVINNKAYIYFDSNAPIITNNWQNKIDNNKPVSAVQPLNPSQLNNAINLVWSGSDSTSGIKYYDIFFRTTSGSYQLLLGNTLATSAVFRGEPDSTYFFYSIATDSAGNVENAPNTADAFTKLSTGIKFIASDIQFNVYPNPANTSGFVDYTLPEAAFVEVALFDVQGRKIVTVLNEKQESEFHQLQLNLQNVEAGMYLVKLTINGQTNIRQLNILH